MHDVQLAVRHLLRRPGFSLVAVVTLALGIGANTAVFTVFHAVLLAPLPYHKPDNVVVLHEQTPNFPRLSVTRYNYDDWRARARSFSEMGAVRATFMTAAGGPEPERVPVKMITASILPVLGVQVADGRRFGDADDRPGAEPVALLGAAFAARSFPDGDVLGRPVQLDGHSYTVVGILPPRFELFQPADVYLPFGPWAATLPEDRGWHPGILPIARLREGVSLEQAQQEMRGIAQQLEAEHPVSNADVGVLVTRVQDDVVRYVKPALLVLLGAVTLVLLIACANVANLLLARGVGRQKEIAVRFALGARRGRIVRQLIVESLVLACVGGAAGLLLATWGVSFLAGMAAGVIPRAYNIEVAWHVGLFAFALSMATGIVFGLAPALHATRCDIRTSLNEEGRGGLGSGRHRRMRSHLVVAEVALALVLLVGAGLLLRSFSTLTAVPTGFDPGNLLVVSLPLSPGAYADAAARTAVVDRIVGRVRELPGVEKAAITTLLPMSGGGASIHFNRSTHPPDGPDDYTVAGFRAVTPDYLTALRVPLRQGRMLSEHDVDGAPPVAMINETMARQYFPDVDPVGQLVQFGTVPTDLPRMEIVGIAGDIRQSFDGTVEPELFVPYGQHPPGILTPMYLTITLVVRTAVEPMTIAPSIRSVVRAIDPGQPLVAIRTMEAVIDRSVAQPRLQMLLLVIFAILAILLAAVGVYGVMAYTVWQRIPEIGVRMAIGATPGRLTAMIVWEGARLALVGLALGFAAAMFAGRAVQSMLFDVHGLDPMTFAVAPLVLALAALVAAYIPARRAARMAPVEALARQEA